MSFRHPLLFAARLLAFALLFTTVTNAQDAPRHKTTAEMLGYPADSRLLIIHADDFGMMHSVNTAIEEALEKHWVTSASILVPCPWFPEVATWAKSHPDADLGIHLALNADWTSYRWSSVSPQPKGSSLLDADGYLPLTSEYVDAHARPEDVEVETHAQIDKALAAGIRLSHLDTHMGTIATTTPLMNEYVKLGHAYHLPVLLEHDGVTQGKDGMHASIFGHDVLLNAGANEIVIDRVLQMTPGVPKAQWLDAYKKMLQPLPPGTYQLIVHLAHDGEEIRGATFDHPDWGAEWRQNDLDLVSSPAFQKFLKDQGFILITWRQLAPALQQAAGAH